MNYVASFGLSSKTNIEVFVVYKDNNPWILLPSQYPIKGLHHHKIIDHTLILCHEKKGLFFYNIETQQLITHLEYPEGYEVSCIERESYNKDNSNLLLSGSVRDEEAEINDDCILLIDIKKPLLRRQAFNIEKKYWSVAVEMQTKSSWVIIDKQYSESYGYQDVITHWNPEEETTISQPFLSQPYDTHGPDTWISPSGKKVVRTKYQGAEIIYKKGDRHLRHYVEVFDAKNTFKVETLLIRDIHHHHIGYLHASPEKMKEEGHFRFDEWEETWKLLHASKSAYKVYNFARYIPKIHKPIRWIWNKFHSSLAEEYLTPIERVINETDDIHNDLYCVTWEENEDAFWVLFRGAVIRRVSLSGKLSSLFVFSYPNTTGSCMFPFLTHTRCLEISCDGIISVKEDCIGKEKYYDQRFSFDPKQFDISDPNKVIVLTPDNCTYNENNNLGKLQENIDEFLHKQVDFTFELPSTDIESIKAVLLKLAKRFQEGVDSHVYQGKLHICFIHQNNKYYEAEFFNEIATSPRLADTIKFLLKTYLKALSKAKHQRLYDGESAVLEYALMRWLILMDAEDFLGGCEISDSTIQDFNNKLIPPEILDVILKWLKVYRTNYGLEQILPYLLERYAIDRNWLILHFWATLSATHVTCLGNWNDKQKTSIEEKFTEQELSNLFLNTYDSLWEYVMLPAIINDAYDEALDEPMTKEQLAKKIKKLKKERFKSEVERSKFSDEVKNNLISNIDTKI